jgi:hypothetical protein
MAEMITVKTTKQISRHIFKNTIGQISRADLINYGVEERIAYKNKIAVQINGDCQHILNTDLELVN